MTHFHRPDKKNWRNVYILIGLLVFTAPWLFLIDSGKPQIKYIDVPVPSEPQACSIAPATANPICDPDSVWPEPSDMPTPWKIIPKPHEQVKLRNLRKSHKSKQPLEYIDANGTRFYPMRNYPY